MITSVLEYCSKELSKDNNKKIIREKIIKPALEIILTELKDYMVIFGAVFITVFFILICILVLLIIKSS
jgi:hypothetical protein